MLRESAEKAVRLPLQEEVDKVRVEHGLHERHNLYATAITGFHRKMSVNATHDDTKRIERGQRT